MDGIRLPGRLTYPALNYERTHSQFSNEGTGDMRQVTRIWLTLVALAIAAPVAAQEIPTDAAIRTILEERLAATPTVGIVVGIVDATGAQRIIAHGYSGTARALDERSVFEIGSITKVFTTSVLALMVAAGEVGLDDPVASYLSASVTVPSRGGKSITLGLLATQSSGLPRMPTNFQPADPNNPYADYTVEQMYEFISDVSLTRDPGAEYEYSNLGVGLLGHVLALRAESSYEALVTERVLSPLGMHDTRIALNDDMQERLALGHNQGGEVVSNWDFPTLAGAGALRSTVVDMLKFIHANLTPSASSISGALALTHGERVKTGQGTMTVGLGWHRRATSNGGVTVWHNGGTGGYRTWAGFDAERQIGAVVLHNSARSVDDIGFHILDSEFPLADAPQVRTEVSVEPAVLETYVGEYELAPQFVITITRDNDQLLLQATGQPRFPIFAESQTKFFLKAVEAQITFELDDDHRVTGLVLHQNGQNVPGKRR